MAVMMVVAMPMSMRGVVRFTMLVLVLVVVLMPVLVLVLVLMPVLVPLAVIVIVTAAGSFVPARRALHLVQQAIGFFQRPFVEQSERPHGHACGFRCG